VRNQIQQVSNIVGLDISQYDDVLRSMGLHIEVQHVDIRDQTGRLSDNVNMYDELMKLVRTPQGEYRNTDQLFSRMREYEYQNLVNI